MKGSKEAEIYPIEAWNVTETSFKRENNYRNETTFALSNGYIGTRGTLEEGYDFSIEEGLEGNFVNGFYESEDIRYGEWNYGFPKKSQSLLNLPNGKRTRIYLDGEMFDLRKGEVRRYKRTLFMKEGFVRREVEWISPAGKEAEFVFERLVSMTHKNVMAQRVRIRLLEEKPEENKAAEGRRAGKIVVQSYLDGDVENHTRKTNPLVDYGPFGKRLETEKCEASEALLYYEGRTKKSGFRIGCGVAAEARWKSGRSDEEEERAVEPAECRMETGGCYAKAEREFLAEAGQELVFDTYIVYFSSQEATGSLYDAAARECGRCREIGYERLKAEQREAFRAFWKYGDVKIKGDDRLCQGIRFNLFHIMQAAGRNGKTGMGAKGLSGEGYEGHYFWDTEMYILPVFVYTAPEIAKALLEYRYSTLEQARARARVLGHPKGALFPWRTINGEEASTYFPLGTAQYHINADIAYAFKLYVDVSGDYDYLEKRAAEVLVETARVWADVGCFVPSKGGRYCICSVTGPDEYNAIVDNNFYTNLMARENIKDALWALKEIGKRNRTALEELSCRLGITGEETEYWEKIVEKMYFPYDGERQIYPLDDGFMMRKPWDESKIPEEKRHLLYENYHPLFIYRQRMSKQADAILGMLLHCDLFSVEELRRNYDFYQEVTLHHSSLSTCIFGMLACRIGYREEAYRYFAESARMDLDDYHDNFYAGIHAANMAGTWQAIVFGFGGVRVYNSMLLIEPFLPEAWEGYSFRISYQGSQLKISTRRNGTEVELENDVPVCFMARGAEKELKRKGEKWIEEISRDFF